MLGWGGFWILTVVWGSLFLFSRVGVASIDPIHITFIRLGVAAVGMNLIVILRRLPVPRDARTISHIVINGIGGLMIPIFMLNIGIQTVESGLSSVIQSTAAVFAAVVAHFVFADERLTPIKFFGVIVSFVGVIVLTQRGNPTDPSGSSLGGQIALIAGALFYAGFTIHSRVLIKQNIKPTVFSAIAMTSATVGIGIIMIFNIATGHVSPALPTTLAPEALAIMLILAVVHSFLAYLLYYEVVARIGAASSTMVTYTIPPVALILGIIFLNESLDTFIVIGSALIFFGIALTNVSYFERADDFLRGLRIKKGRMS